MTGLLSLLDDVVALARLASTQLDDVAAQAAKAGTKAAGVVIDDGAVTPKYVQGLPAAREIPIVLRIARGSIFNKVVVLLPAALLLSAFAPWAVSPLLMVGGAYLCFEGAEKVWEKLFHRGGAEHAAEAPSPDAAHLEETRVKGAIKTDFILSAEIMAISLAAIDADTLWIQAVVLLLVAIGITALVYGGVAIIVKADDVGVRLAQTEDLPAVQALGRGIVRGMPAVLTSIGVVGTAAMLWVGGSILLHGLEEFGVSGPAHWIHDVAVAAAARVDAAPGLTEWAVTAGLDGLFGLVVGLCLIPIVTRVVPGEHAEGGGH